MIVRRGAVLLLGAVVVVSLMPGGAARAESPEDPCFASPLEGQKLRRGGKLLDARQQFATCSHRTCPAEIVRACVRWKGEVDAAMPSVVLAAQDAQGRDLTEVQVSIDGKPPADVSALAIELDPGPHQFVFERGGDPPVTRQAVLREGEKNRPVVAAFPSRRVALPEAPPAETAPAQTAPPVARPVALPATARPMVPPTQEEPERERRPVSTGTWILAGTGTIALAGFAAFAGLGLSERANDHCATGCTQSQFDRVTTDLRVADVTLAVGVVSLAAAAWLVLGRPAAKRSVTAWIDVRPAPGAGTLLVGSVF
jgi:hypothetical protein